jgi:hypothetical protein
MTPTLEIGYAGEVYRFWELFIRPLLQASGAKHVVEIGAEDGKLTHPLASFCRERGGMLHVIDPFPLFEQKPWYAQLRPFIDLHRLRSLEALPKIARHDAVIIDGDHNWYTVFHELRLLEEKAKSGGSFPLVLLHDTDWPYARRDMYYRPEDIPESYRKHYGKGGMIPARRELLEIGGMNQRLWNATEEGGERNGVLTAVEDFLSQTSLPLRVFHLKGLYGLSILGPAKLWETAGPIATVLAEFSGPEKLQAQLICVEEDRLQCEVALQTCRQETKDMQDHLTILKQQYDLMKQDLEAAQKASEADRQDLRASRQALDASQEMLQKIHAAWETSRQTLDRIRHTRSWRYTAWFRRLF